MRLRKKRWAKPELEKDDKVIFVPSDFKGKWKEVFGNDHPIQLELGCGRGNFITRLAGKTSGMSYIAIDTHPELLVWVIRKLNANYLDNVRVLPMNIANIDEVFGRDEIDKIYINFCNPWPSNRHHKRRLTHPNFLNRYKVFLKNDAEIWFKTDDDALFADSLKYFCNTGFTEIFRTDDLALSGFGNNILTEYEERFISQGIRIKFGIFKNPGDRNDD